MNSIPAALKPRKRNTDDFVRSPIPAINPKMIATSIRKLLARMIEKRKIQMIAAFTPESTRAIRS
jgi:hypothetical protein